MKKKSILFILALTLVICIAGSITSFASANIPKSVAEKKESVVRIVKCFDDGTISSGTGFVIDVEDQYTVFVTSYETVIEKNRAGLYVFLNEEEYIEATVVVVDSTRDLAVIAVPYRMNVEPVKFVRTNIKKDADVYEAGHPGGSHITYNELEAMLGEPVITAGKVLDRQKVDLKSGNNIRALQIDTASADGNSGGPVFNKFGEATGVIPYYLHEDTKQYHNAIEADEVKRFLTSHGIPFEIALFRYYLFKAIIAAIVIVLTVLFIVRIIKRRQRETNESLGSILWAYDDDYLRTSQYDKIRNIDSYIRFTNVKRDNMIMFAAAAICIFMLILIWAV